MALIRNLKIWKGETWSRGFAIVKDGLPIEDGWTVAAAVKGTSNAPLHTWSTASGNASLLDGVLVLSVLPATSNAWQWTNGTYDLTISKDGVVERVFTGSVFVHE